jgi:thiol-disulfide isomerase/thioredoxin
MKRFITAFLLIFLVSPVFAQNQFQVLTERPNEKTLKGIISREVLVADTSFKWYAQNLKSYTPYADAVTALKKNADSVQLITFIGTWCEDSHFVIPRLYSVLDAAGFSSNKMSLLGVDRAKKTLSHLTEALNIINVPTIIVMKNGKELGRVVEYGKYGLFEKELAEILTAAGR